MMILCGVNLNCVTDKERKQDGMEISWRRFEEISSEGISYLVDIVGESTANFSASEVKDSSNWVTIYVKV
jgi:hypothetical protein